jgi:hypothetical protein
LNGNSDNYENIQYFNNEPIEQTKRETISKHNLTGAKKRKFGHVFNSKSSIQEELDAECNSELADDEDNEERYVQFNDDIDIIDENLGTQKSGFTRF